MSQQQQQHCVNIELAEDPKGDWLSNSRSTLLVVVTLITTLSFQLGVNPPGGFWQDDKDGHKAGTPVMMDKMKNKFTSLRISSWLCFYSSVLLLFVLLTGTSIKSKFFKSIFVFCLSSLVFLYQISQTANDQMLGAFVTTAIVFVGGLYYILVK